MTLLPARGRLTIRVNVGATTLYVAGNLATSIVAFQDMFGAADRFVRNMTIGAMHIRSRKSVTGLAAQDSDALIFETADFGRISVTDYFALRTSNSDRIRLTHSPSSSFQGYGILLAFSHLRLVEVGPAVRLPPEVCTILPDQPFRGSLPDTCAAAMTNVARVSPNENGLMIQQLGQQPVGSILSSFGVNIGSDMLETYGRVLPKPSVIYSAKSAHVNNHAQWDLGDAKFVVGAHLDRWVVLVIKDDYRGSRSAFTDATDPELQEAVRAFRDICNHKGMNITADPSYTIVQLPRFTADDPMRGGAITAVRAGLMRNRPKPHAVLVTLTSSDKLVYEGVKHLCDGTLDVTTLCVLSSKFRAARPQYLSSLALKLNMKLGGINHRLDGECMSWLNAAPTMVVGMDIAHPEPGCVTGTRECTYLHSQLVMVRGSLSASIAAVVASVEKHFAQYLVSLRTQTSRQEVNVLVLDHWHH